MADWTLLPNDMLELIADRFETFFEIVLFRSVCRSWRSVLPLPDNTRRCLNIETVIPFNDDFSFSGKENDKCTLKKNSYFLVRFQTPFGDDYLVTEMQKEMFDGSILMSSPLSYNSITCDSRMFPTFFNSLFSQIIPFGDYYKITYLELKYSNSRRWPGPYLEETSDKCEFLELPSRDFVVLARANTVTNLMMYRSCNKTWTLIVDHPNKTDVGLYQDMIAFKGKFYAVDSSGWGHVFVIEPSMEVSEIPSIERKSLSRSFSEHLVKSGEELLLVQRFSPSWTWHGRDNMYTWFRVFSLDEEGSRRKWVEVNDLNDRVIFLGSETKLCCSVQKLPGAKENCIVFIDYPEDIIYDPYLDNDSILVYDLKTRRTGTAFSECKGYMGAFGKNFESLVLCGVVTIPNLATEDYNVIDYEY